VTIHEEKATDITQITELHNQAFNGPDEGKIVDNLRKNKKLIISLVCELNGKVVGHIAYSPIFNDKKIIGLGLAPLAVLPDNQKQGIGSELIRQGNRIALSKGYKKIFVLGYPDYYSRFGFKPAKEYNYFSKFDPEGDHFMVIGSQLENEPEKVVVNYCEEFNV
jgi:putative acetyltransferase